MAGWAGGFRKGGQSAGCGKAIRQGGQTAPPLSNTIHQSPPAKAASQTRSVHAHLARHLGTEGDVVIKSGAATKERGSERQQETASDMTPSRSSRCRRSRIRCLQLLRCMLMRTPQESSSKRPCGCMQACTCVVGHAMHACADGGLRMGLPVVCPPRCVCPQERAAVSCLRQAADGVACVPCGPAIRKKCKALRLCRPVNCHVPDTCGRQPGCAVARTWCNVVA